MKPVPHEIAGSPKNQVKWCAQGDDFRTFLGELVSTLRGIESPLYLEFG